MPRAYFLTWTTYGTWLHGDERGSVDYRHNVYGRPLLEPSDRRRAVRTAQLRSSAFVLNADARAIVRETIARHCEVRSWELLELNVRTNHAHVVVGAASGPDEMMSQFKAWATRRLREAGVDSREQRVWSEGGSTRYLWDEESVARACRYVRDGQGADI